MSPARRWVDLGLARGCADYRHECGGIARRERTGGFSSWSHGYRLEHGHADFGSDDHHRFDVRHAPLARSRMEPRA